MGYSKLKKIKAVNFRSLGSVEIDLTDSPIVALTGTNEGGKSSIIRAFGAAASNMWRTKQNQYIRTGTDGFAVLLELEDGTKVLRKKSSSLNSFTLVRPDGQRIDATKIDVEVPDYIEAVMGMFRDPETRENLQVRTCDDPLIFVNTTDGQNYKAVHNAINNLDVREATIKAKSDASGLLEKANKKRDEVDVYKKQLLELPLLDTDYLRVVLSALERGKRISAQFDEAKRNVTLLDNLDGEGDAKKLKKCKIVDAEAMRVYTDAMRHLAVAREADAVCYDEVGVVDTAPIPLFERGLKYKADVKASSISEIPNTVLAISTEVLPLFEKARNHKSVIAEASESYAKLVDGIKKVTEAIKTSGIRVVSCDKCGNDIAIPMEA